MSVIPQSLELGTESWLLVIVAGAITLYALSAVVAWRRLRHFNGPGLASFTYLWLMRAFWSGEVHYRLSAAHNKYGETVRVGPNELITSDPKVVDQISGARSK
jgi:hypothetical protein